MKIRQSIPALDHFETLPDPRQRANVLYPLQEIILTSLCAIL